MVFSNNTESLNDFSFSFKGKHIPLASSYKHLRVSFISDEKWNNHVNNIISSVTKHLSVLRKLKYRLNMHTDKIWKNLVYIRLIFEYACEDWDNCGLVNQKRLEKLQRPQEL